MLDLKQIINNRESIESKLKLRDPEISLDLVIALANQRNTLQQKYDSLRQEIKTGSNTSLVNNSSDYIQKTRQELKEKGNYANEVKKELTEVSTHLREELLKLPNILTPDVPISNNKEDGVIVKSYGLAPSFNFSIKDHFTLCKELNMLDMDRGAKIAGTGFPVYKGKGAILEWALLNYMIDHSVKNNFEFILFPLLNNKASLTASGNLPKFANELYASEIDELYAIPTAEVPLTSMYRDEILNVENLPIRMISYSPCFRREAGSYGQLTKGLMRLHQFNKVESYSICTPSESKTELEILVDNASEIVKNLDLHFRVVNLPSCDIAQQSAQTFDVEIWLPYAKKYSEVSSASNCLDYQARRANISFKDNGEKKYVHTLNCSALATPRLFISLVESNQTPDGRIIIPEALRKYTGFDEITK